MNRDRDWFAIDMCNEYESELRELGWSDSYSYYDDVEWDTLKLLEGQCKLQRQLNKLQYSHQPSNSIKCPSCLDGKIYPAFPHTKKAAMGITCEDCHGTGRLQISKDQYDRWKESGEKMKNDRIERRMTLKDEANYLGIDVCLLSAMERGVANPYGVR